MIPTDLELLEQYARQNSQEAFATLVGRHLNLVYSAALRQVRSPQLAEEAAQSVFADLARTAEKLSPGTVLTAWLYQVTRRTAIDVVRRESRRQLREQIALEVADMKSDASEWFQIEPLLDEAMDSLDETDRSAILLRYFENKNLRDVGQTLGTSEDAAQKRVSRAVDRLREYFDKRGITVGATGLTAIISANAIQAAPVGLSVTISAALTGTAVSTSVIAATTTIAMTTLQKTIITVALAAAVGAGVYQARQVSELRARVGSLQQQQVPLAAQLQQLERERDDASNRLALLIEENAALKRNPAEVLTLRGEVGRLRQEHASITTKSALNKITANPEAKKLLRDQQKTGMSFLYKAFSRRSNLPPEQSDQLYELQADYIMQNVDRVTELLRDGADPGQTAQVFAQEDADLLEKIRALLGPDATAQYQEYTRDLGSHLTTEQFKGMLTGDDDAKTEKSKQLYQAMQEETRLALSNAGLPADFQTIPMLNFSNIASEEMGERSLKLLDAIYENVAARGAAFLTPEELAKFSEFRTNALNSSRLALMMNRKMMAPISP